MAAVETLKIQVTADNKQAIAGLQAMKNSLREFEQAIKKSTDPQHIVYLNRNIEILKGRLNDLGGAGMKAGKDFTNLSRVVQDLPFGLIGVQNNLTQLIPGVGAAGLAFSALVSAITFSQTGLSNWIRGSKEATKEGINLSEVYTEEAARLQVLNKIATDATIPMDKRREATRQIIEDYDEYLPKLSQEAILQGKAADAIQRATDALLAKASAQAAEKRLSELGQKNFELQQKQTTLLEKQAKISKDLRAGKGGSGVAGAFSSGGLNILTVQLTEVDSDLASIGDKIKENNAEFQKTLKIAADFATQAGKFLGGEGPTGGGSSEKEDKFAQWNKEFRELIHNAEVFYMWQSIIQKQVDSSTVQSARNTPVMPNAPQEVSGISQTGRQIGQEFKNNNAAKQEAADQKELTRDLENTAAAANFTADAFGNLFDQLMQGESAGEAIGNMFKQIAADIAKAAIKALAFAAIMSVFSGGGTFGANFLKSFGGFFGLKLAEGGVTTGPTPALIGEAGPEAVIPLDRLGAFVDHAAKIGASMGNMGGGAQPILLDTRLVGNDIWLSQRRTDFARNLRT